MNSRFLIWVGFILGSTIGSFVPLLWGGNSFSLSGILLNALGGALGIWAGYKLSAGL